jgi:hypothetical protein
MPLKKVVGGIYSLQPLPSHWLSLLAMGTPDSPVVHWTSTVHCPVRAMSARPLGFGEVDRWNPLSCSCTGQSGGTPDMSGVFWLSALTSDFHCSFLQSTVGARLPLLRWLTELSGAHRTVRWIIAEHALRKPESGCSLGARPDAPNTVRCATGSTLSSPLL